MSILQPPKTYLWVWFTWLVIFYVTWACLVLLGDCVSDVITHWPMALAMALGSYAAGSTPMGGGTVGFPVLVLLFDMPASLGRDFSFAVQSIGMTSASIFILARRQPLAVSVLQGAVCGAIVGTPLGIFFIAPLIPELWIKVCFSIIWAGFGLLHLYRINEIASNTGIIDFSEKWDFRLGLLLGFLASLTVVSVTGVGIDMIIYAALVLLCRADLKIAIPTSVVIMAFNSVYGVLIKSATTGFQAGTYENWLAAAPVVALGAPLGVLIVGLVGRKPTLLFVAVLCVGQYIWTCVNERHLLGVSGILITLLFVGGLLYVFERLRVLGNILSINKTADIEASAHHITSLGIPDVEPHLHSGEETHKSLKN